MCDFVVKIFFKEREKEVRKRVKMCKRELKLMNFSNNPNRLNAQKSLSQSHVSQTGISHCTLSSSFLYIRESCEFVQLVLIYRELINVYMCFSTIDYSRVLIIINIQHWKF